MKRFVICTILTLILAPTSAVRAGDMPSGDFVPPPPASNHPTTDASEPNSAVPLRSGDLSAESVELFDAFVLSIVSLLVP
jgi:hypothetical protein